ncbi:MAG: hypothetical protein CMD81_15835 [Gammaproteobacteria bacterium]|nr:hypothetical protein [Gammaproteobacteria bacterium]HBF10039.1 hypothetical protein [Gammaproteobacteria bacterium]|tara:strand:- start:38400 stop:39455 length:1056 start_codon:yes stop_codon:yes gene_type:complete
MVEKSMFDFAIIGAGASGVYAARLLREQAKQQGKNVRICLVEKSRGLGGRLSTRRVYLDDGRMVQVELGAVNVGHAFQSQALQGQPPFGINPPQLKHWEELEVLQGLSKDYLRELQEGTDIDGFLTQSRLVRLEQSNQSLANQSQGDHYWTLHLESTAQDKPALEPIKAREVIMTAPPEQVKAILKDSGLEQSPLMASIVGAEMACRFTWVLVTQGAALETSQHFFKNDAMLDNLLVLSHKPGIQSANGYEQIQVNMTLDWSQLHAAVDKQQVQQDFENDVLTRIKTLIPDLQNHNVISFQVHKWLYAQPKSPATVPLKSDNGLTCIGDWTCGYGLDDALRSAETLIQNYA